MRGYVIFLISGICLYSILGYVTLNAQGESQTFTYNISKTTEKIDLDGSLEDDAWKGTQVISSFTRTYPTDNGIARSRTQIRMCYDERYLYISAVCMDSIDGKFIVESLKRDFSYPRTDAVAVFFNPMNDDINGFSFGVNPYGAQREGLIASGGTFGVTTAWDNKWYSKTTRLDGKWVAEMAIPFKSLRYSRKLESWNVNFGRQDLKLNESSTWVPVPRGFNVASLAYRGQLIWGAPPPKPGSNIALIPYSSIKYSKEGIGDDMDHTFEFDLGIDAKIALGSSLNLDVTVNPDFSQVDVDQQIINLDRFSLFFPEKRNFFLENSDLFSDFGFSTIRPFFSRRIGLQSGITVPILAGVRLSGNINENWRIGIMDVQTEGVSSLTESQNYAVAAVQRNILKRSNIGAIIVNRQAFSGSSAIKGDFNTIAGVDFNINSENNKIKGKLYYHQSFSDSMPPNAFSHAFWLQYTDPKWYVVWNHEYVGSNYRADVGFVPRTSFYRFEPFLYRTFYPKSKLVNNYSLRLYQSYYLNLESLLTDRVVKPSFITSFENQSLLEFYYRDLKTVLFNPFNPVGEGESLPPGDYFYRNAGVVYNSNFRKAFSFNAEVNYGSFFNGRKLTYKAGVNYKARPWGSFSLNFERNEIDLPDPYSDGNPTLVGLEAELTFTNSLFWTTFIQYNTQIDNININSKIRWEFAPLSNIYLVYTDNYDNDFMNKNRAIVLKVNYWFSI